MTLTPLPERVMNSTDLNQNPTKPACRSSSP